MKLFNQILSLSLWVIFTWGCVSCDTRNAPVPPQKTDSKAQGEQSETIEPQVEPESEGSTQKQSSIPVEKSPEQPETTSDPEEDHADHDHDRESQANTDSQDSGPEPIPLSDKVKVDTEAKEVVVPCLFVSPTQALEVFACHIEGPAHEAVVVFRASGEDIYLGLMELGLRGPEFWDATSRVAQGKPDVRYTLGDRVVVLLRWKQNGEQFEYPAEKLMRESFLGTSPFVRGFTFSAVEIPIGDPPVKKVPSRVEITMGGATRGEKAVESILFHANDLREITPWMPPLEIHPTVLPDIKKLVEEDVECELVIQLVSGEVELLQVARRHEKDEARRKLLTQWMPQAEKIDQVKKEYAELVQKMNELVFKGEAAKTEEEATKIALEVQKIFAQGRLEKKVLEIWSLYLNLYVEQEKLRTNSLESKTEEDLGPISMAKASLERFQYELKFLEIERKAIEIQYSEEVLSEKNKLILEGLAHRLEALKHESYLPLAKNEIEEVRLRLKELDPKEDRYHIRLLEEKELEMKAALLQIQAKRDELLTLDQENHARSEGKWNDIQEEVIKKRLFAQSRLRWADKEREKVQVLSDIRWAENFLSDESLPDERRKEQEEALKNHTAKLKAIDEEIKKLKAEVDKGSSGK